MVLQPQPLSLLRVREVPPKLKEIALSKTTFCRLSFLSAMSLALVVCAAAAWAAKPSLLLVSRADGKQGETSGAAEAVDLSRSGRYAVFHSTEGLTGTFLRDLRRGRTWDLGDVYRPQLSGDLSRIAYTDNGNVFVRALRGGKPSNVSRAVLRLRRGEVGGSSSHPSISGDGRYVAFSSNTGWLVDEDHDGEPNVPPGVEQVYVRDLKTKTTRLISRADGRDGRIGDAESTEPVISENGLYVAFASVAGNLLPGAPHHSSAIYVRDLQTERTRRVSHWRSRPGPHRSYANHPSISADGRIIAFHFVRRSAPPSVVVRDLRTGKTVNASSFTRTPLKPASGSPVLSGDGRFVAFKAGSANPRGFVKLFIVDLETHRTQLVHGVRPGEEESLSFDGRFVLFDTFQEPDPKGPLCRPCFSGEVYRYRNPLLRGGG